MSLQTSQLNKDNCIDEIISSTTFQDEKAILKLRTNNISKTNITSSVIPFNSASPPQPVDEPRGKNIVLCFDGTKKDFDSVPYPYSNVLRMVFILETESSEQVCYYEPGTVSFIPKHDRQSIFYRVSKLKRDMKDWYHTHTAALIEHNILKAYRYLVRNYEIGSKLYFFGVGLGALTARILAAMIEKVGVLNHGMEAIIPNAWNIYKAWELAEQPGPKTRRSEILDLCKLLFSHRKVNLCFMGLWDSNNASSSIGDYDFPFTPKNDQIEHIRHALSIDERRARLKPNSFHPYYCRTNEKKKLPNKWLQPHLPKYGTRIKNLKKKKVTARYKYEDGNLKKFTCTKNQTEKETETTIEIEEDPKLKRPPSDIVEMWFPGDNFDVTGGWLPDCEAYGEYLSFIPARWMIAEAFKFGVLYRMAELKRTTNINWGLNFSLLAKDHDYLSFKSSKLKNCPTKTPPTKDSLNVFGNVPGFPGNEECDENGLIYKENAFGGHGNKSIFRTLGYWILEIFPIPHRTQNEERKWVKTYKPNFGRRRNIPSNAQFHWSVKWRMKLANSYNPKNLPSSFDNRIEEDDTIPDDFKDIIKDNLL